ncbi:hypothetical protein [Streptomyces noursei]|uniref:hypothetical protein n=1 Tax=Streptomyces noursei TaxID=1971 RepID=UPI0011AED49C|nr:hypothetical protein [Streptomyces noursei]
MTGDLGDGETYTVEEPRPMSLIATVTLPDGTPAVVHSEALGWGDGHLAGRDRAELTDAVLLSLVGEASCPTLDAACPGEVTFDGGHAAWAGDHRPTCTPEVDFPEHGEMVWSTVRALGREERCRVEAETYDLGEVHPDAPLARAWAAGQAALAPATAWSPPSQAPAPNRIMP